MPHVMPFQPTQHRHSDQQADQQPKPLCFFTVVRYVADPVRNEPKNIGVLLVCPERTFGGVEYNISRSGIPTSTPQYAILEDLLRQYKIALPGRQPHQPSLFAPVPALWTNKELEELHFECSNAIQFTKPAAALGEPTELLRRLYQERVAPYREEIATVHREETKEKENKPAFSSRVAARALRKRLSKFGKQEWVHEDAVVTVEGHPYRFGLTVSNGHLQYAAETLSFHTTQAARLSQAEHTGAWFAQVWPEIARTTGAHGLLLVEPPAHPSELLPTQEGQLAEEEFSRVTQWATSAGIEVRHADEIEMVAEKIASELG